MAETFSIISIYFLTSNCIHFHAMKKEEGKLLSFVFYFQLINRETNQALVKQRGVRKETEKVFKNISRMSERERIVQGCMMMMMGSRSEIKLKQYIRTMAQRTFIIFFILLAIHTIPSSSSSLPFLYDEQNYERVYVEKSLCKNLTTSFYTIHKAQQ